jgi:hypothetical protein
VVAVRVPSLPCFLLLPVLRRRRAIHRSIPPEVQLLPQSPLALRAPPGLPGQGQPGPQLRGHLHPQPLQVIRMGTDSLS